MKKNDPKKAKAKGGKSAGKAAKLQAKRKKENKAVLADLELREEELDAATGGTLTATLNPTSLTNPTATSPKTTTKPTNVTGVTNDLLDALNLGLY